MTFRVFAWLACVVFAVLSAPARAHLIQTGLGPVYDGMLHCLLTPTNVMATVALALLAGLRGARHVRFVMFVLPVAWLVGGYIGLANKSAMPALDWIPLLLFGILCAANLRLPLALTTILAALLGLYCGYATGIAMVPPGAGAWGLLGASIVVFIVVTLTGALVVSGRSQVAHIAARVAGSWIAASGILLLGWSLR